MKFSEIMSGILKWIKNIPAFFGKCARAMHEGFTAFLYHSSTALSWIAVIFAIIFVIICLWGVFFNHPIAPHFEDNDGYYYKLTLGWDWVAVGIACLSLFYACVTFNSQRNTEQNTMKITPESQREILMDYCRHFYRNLVIICAIENKLAEQFDSYYPSEEHLLKLKADLDDLHPAAFYNHHDRYRAIQELLVKMRNFNTEVDVAKVHLCDRHVDHDSKRRDFATLKFKMGFLTEKTYETLCKLWPNEDWKMLQNIKAMLIEQAEKDVKKYSDKVEELMKSHVPTPYFDVTDTFFTKGMFETKQEFDERKENERKGIASSNTDTENETDSRPISPECRDFMVKLNVSIWIEMTQKSKNSFASSEKIHLIPFDKKQPSNAL